MDPAVIRSVLMRGRQEGQSHSRRCDHGNRRGERERDSLLLALKTEKWAIRPQAKAGRWPPEPGKGKESNSPLQPKGTSPPNTLMLVP